MIDKQGYVSNMLERLRADEQYKVSVSIKDVSGMVEPLVSSFAECFYDFADLITMASGSVGDK